MCDWLLRVSTVYIAKQSFSDKNARNLSCSISIAVFCCGKQYRNRLTFNQLTVRRLTSWAASAAASLDAGERRAWLNQSVSGRVHCCLSLTRWCRRLTETILYATRCRRCIVLWFHCMIGSASRSNIEQNASSCQRCDVSVLSRAPQTTASWSPPLHSAYHKFYVCYWGAASDLLLIFRLE